MFKAACNNACACALWQVRLGALRCVACALGDPEHGTMASATDVLREEESAPLLGHLASILLQVGCLLMGCKVTEGEMVWWSSC